jgi:hypothetical protein
MDTEFAPLLDDIKLIAKCAKVVTDENDQIKRQYAFGLLSDLIDRHYYEMEKKLHLLKTKYKKLGK